jgi:formate dehydrogenase maturation protein FdhE
MPPSPADDARWDTRVARAQQLANEHPAVSAILLFYAALAGFQQSLPRAASLDIDGIVAAVPEFLDFVQRSGPARLTHAIEPLRRIDAAHWRRLLECCWRGGVHDADANDLTVFVVESLLQPSAEERALAMEAVEDASPPPGCHPERSEGPAGTNAVARCPACSGKPVVGVLRASGQSARRSLVCGLCAHEWSWPRIVCPVCGEHVFDRLAVYRADEFPLARVDACDTCHTYLKTIDLSTDARAVPIVDELAAVPLDLWAREQGYTKLRLNLLRM